jgi:hypothetical protein
MEQQEAYQRAKKRAEAKFGFYIHLSVYITVSILLIVLNLSTSNNTYGSSDRSWDGASVYFFML